MRVLEKSKGLSRSTSLLPECLESSIQSRSHDCFAVVLPNPLINAASSRFISFRS